jgi:hypothetical protein
MHLNSRLQLSLLLLLGSSRGHKGGLLLLVSQFSPGSPLPLPAAQNSRPPSIGITIFSEQSGNIILFNAGVLESGSFRTWLFSS